jgi:hypothetical protein
MRLRQSMLSRGGLAVSFVIYHLDQILRRIRLRDADTRIKLVSLRLWWKEGNEGCPRDLVHVDTNKGSRVWKHLVLCIQLKEGDVQMV